MAKIDDITQDKIKRSAKIADVLEASGFRLRRNGASWICDCPFHTEATPGGFVVNTRDNYYHCFSCGASGDPIKFLREYEKMDYQTALRYLAAMYNIYIDDQPTPKVEKREPRQPLPPKQWIVWSDLERFIKPYLHHAEQNPLLTWMLALPMQPEQKHQLRQMIELYFVGTSLQGYTKGWTIWPQVDMDLKIRDMKFMCYKPDGHRDKAHNPNWMSSILASNKQFDRDTQEVRRCLFGLHLAKLFTEAEVCIVESEKTAVICSAVCDPKQKRWMAVGGLQFFKAHMLEPLIQANRYIVLYPDADGMEQWREMMKTIGYGRMSMTAKMLPVPKGLYNPTLDGPKADIADIMIRLMHGIEETEAEKVARQLGAPDKAKDIQYLMDKLDLQRV